METICMELRGASQWKTGDFWSTVSFLEERDFASW